MEPFSPGTNVVVGRNGSGKSNFFAAIRFVLGDDYNNVGREDRQALLHEGSGSAVMSAYVEIIFDNSDGRFQTPNQEVVIRRTIALKKDEYSLDKKAVPKSEVFDLLEGAGFSRANPYYIVPQGRVTELTNQKESQRLKLLKGIAGTETYDNKRAESQKIMQDTMKRREKIDELLEVITGRLEELEGEKEELRQFQEKDKERRCLEYAYYHQHQEAVQLALSEVEEARQGGASSSKQEQDAFQAGELKVQAIDSEIAELQQEIEILEGERRHLEEDRRAATRIRAKAEMQVKNLDDTRDVRLEAKREHDDTLAEVRRQIRSKEEALAKIAPRFDKLRQEEEDKKKQLDLAEHTLQRLEAKQTRNSQFKNKKERDAYLQKEIASSGDAISAQKAAGMDAQEEVKSLGVAIAKAIADIEDVRGRISSFPEHKEKLIADLNEAREQLERLQEQKKELVRERETLETMHRKTGAGLQKAEGDLKKCMDRSTHEALKNIRELMKKQDIPGAYGMLADLMTVPKESYEVAVDQVAGGSLFSYVTDNEITSGMIGNHLHAIHGGRITFLPLTKLPTRRVKLPRAPDAEPLIPKIAYDAKYDAAFQHVFGRCIVCPNLAVGAQYARSHNLDCVTLDGEKSNKRGALTGGYVDAGRSRLRTARQVAERRATYEEQYERLRAMDEDGQKLTQEITKAASAEHKLAYELERLRGSWRQLNLEKQDKEHELKRLNTQLEKAKEREKTVERHLEELNEIVTSFQTELASEFKKVLSAHEEEQMELLSVQVREHRKQWKEVRAERLKLESQKKKHEIELNTNLRPQEDQLTSQAMEVLVSEDTTSDKDAKKELQKSQKAVVSIERKLKENEDKISKATAGVQQLGAEKAEKEESQQELAARIEKQRKRIEKNMQRKSLLTQQATNHAKSIRDLGVIPEEAFDKYDRMRVDQVGDTPARRHFVSEMALRCANTDAPRSNRGFGK